MGHQLVSRAAVDGKRPVSKTSPTSELFAQARRLTFAAVAFFMTGFAAPPSHAQSSAVRRHGRHLVRRRHRHARRRLERAHPLPRDLQGRRAQHGHEPHLRQRRLQVQPAGRCRRPGRRMSRAPGAKPAATSAATSRAAAAAAISRWSPSAAGFNASISLKTTGNKQSDRHQGRQPVQGRQHFAVERSAHTRLRAAQSALRLSCVFGLSPAFGRRFP